MDFAQFRTNIDAQIIKQIQMDYARLKEIAHSSQEYFSLFSTQFEKYLIAGKRIRSTIVPYLQLLYTKTYTSQSIKLASIMEYLQSFLLIHDDIMDQDAKRRGLQSMHVFFDTSYGEKYDLKGSSIHDSQLGTSLAICLGDVCFSFCNYLLATIEGLDNFKTISRLFSRRITEVGLAQGLDVLWSSHESMPHFKSIVDMYRGKTGSYTFSLPFQLAVSLCNFPQIQLEEELANVKIIGEELGLVFQIDDDIINLSFAQNLTGKEQYTDLKEKKKTACMALLFEEARERGRLDEVQALFYSKNTESSSIMYFVESWDIIARLKDFTQTRIAKIKHSISELRLEPQAQTAFSHMVDDIVKRISKFEAKNMNVS